MKTSSKQRHRPKKSLGQNFLIDPNYQRKIVDAVIKDYQQETILEIGPGWGALTHSLVEFADNLIAVEKDSVLAKRLSDVLGCHQKIKVINKDFLKWDTGNLSELVVVANLPYNVASQIMIKIFIEGHKYKKLYLMLQKEVAQRCLAQPGTKDYSVLSIWVQLFSTPQKLFDVPNTAFKPKPRVTSSFISLELTHRKYLDEKPFISFVKTLFSQRRKKISTTLKSQDIDLEGLDAKIREFIDKRAEVLTIAELKKIYEAVKARKIKGALSLKSKNAV